MPIRGDAGVRDVRGAYGSSASRGRSREADEVIREAHAPAGVSGAAGEIAAHGREVLGRGQFPAVLRADTGDGEAVVPAGAGVGPGDDHHALALAVEDAARGSAVPALGHHRGEDLDAPAPVEGEGAGIRLGLGADQAFEVFGRPVPVDADVLGRTLVEEGRLGAVLPGELRLSG